MKAIPFEILKFLTIYSLTINVPVLSLKCWNNYCAVGRNGKGITCSVDGVGVHEDCGVLSNDDYKSACFEEPIEEEFGQIKSRGCTTLKMPVVLEKFPECGNETGQLLNGYPSHGCICFEDFCNSRFNNTLKSAYRVENGHPVKKSDGQYVQLITTDSEENFNHQLK